MAKKETSVFYPNGKEEKVSSTEIVAPKGPSNRSYFKWLVSSWAHPAEDAPASKWYGVVTIIAELLVFFGSLYAFFHHVLSNSTLFDITTFYNMLTGLKSGPSELLIYTLLFAYSLIAAIVIIGGTYLVSRYLVSGEKESFWDYTNRLAHYCGLNVILVLLILILGACGVGGRVITVLTSFALMIFSVAVIVAVVGKSNEKGLDKVYAGIVASLITGLGYFVFYLLASSILMKVLQIGISILMQMMMYSGLQ